VVQTLLTSAQNDIFINNLIEVEVASAIARWRRMNEISETDALAIQQKFTEHKILGYYTCQPISCDDFKQATDWLLQRKTALRTCDALHLAFATRIGAVLVTADKKLGQAAKELGADYQLLVSSTH